MILKFALWVVVCDFWCIHFLFALFWGNVIFICDLCILVYFTFFILRFIVNFFKSNQRWVWVGINASNLVSSNFPMVWLSFLVTVHVLFLTTCTYAFVGRIVGTVILFLLSVELSLLHYSLFLSQLSSSLASLSLSAALITILLLLLLVLFQFLLTIQNIWNNVQSLIISSFSWNLVLPWVAILTAFKGNRWFLTCNSQGTRLFKEKIPHFDWFCVDIMMVVLLLINDVFNLFVDGFFDRQPMAWLMG